MRWAVISDLHANLQAFEAVLSDIAAQRVDRTICLGDAVGYGPQPAEVLSLLHTHVHHMIMGNHEAAVAGLMADALFNDDAKRMVAWTRGRLNETALRFIAKLPYKFAAPGLACVHGSFARPADFEYVETEEQARAAFAVRPEPLLFVGHTHEPVVFVLDPAGECRRCEPETFPLEPGHRYLVNPGSAGLPRGSDFRASYCILDTERNEIAFNRVVYDSRLFRQQVERCAGGSEQMAYVLALFDSHALPTLNKKVDFAAATAPAPARAGPPARPPARVVVRKTTVAKGATPARRPSAAARPAPRRGRLVAVALALVLAGGTAAGLFARAARQRAAASSPVRTAAAPAPPVAVLRAAVPRPSDAADAAVAAVLAAPPASSAPPAAAPPPAPPSRAEPAPGTDLLALNVPEAKDYRLVYELDLATLGGRRVSYAVDESGAFAGRFDRVAYFLELQKTDAPVQYVYVSLDAFTDDVKKIGVPTHDTQAVFQQAVSNLTVVSNVPGLPNGTGLAEGNIEFWPSNYREDNAARVPNASGKLYDCGDAMSGQGDGYGSMQVHLFGAGQTLFAINHWVAGVRADIGIGNSEGKTRDWTFTANAASYPLRKLRVLVRPAPAAPTEVNAAARPVPAAPAWPCRASGQRSVVRVWMDKAGVIQQNWREPQGDPS